MEERKRNAIDVIVSMAFLSFSLVLMRIHVTAIIESVRFFVSIIFRVQLRWQRPFHHPHKVKQRRVYHLVDLEH